MACRPLIRAADLVAAMGGLRSFLAKLQFGRRQSLILVEQFLEPHQQSINSALIVQAELPASSKTSMT